MIWIFFRRVQDSIAASEALQSELDGDTGRRQLELKRRINQANLCMIGVCFVGGVFQYVHERQQYTTSTAALHSFVSLFRSTFLADRVQVEPSHSHYYSQCNEW